MQIIEIKAAEVIRDGRGGNIGRIHEPSRIITYCDATLAAIARDRKHTHAIIDDKGNVTQTY